MRRKECCGKPPPRVSPFGPPQKAGRTSSWMTSSRSPTAGPRRWLCQPVRAPDNPAMPLLFPAPHINPSVGENFAREGGEWWQPFALVLFGGIRIRNSRAPLPQRQRDGRPRRIAAYRILQYAVMPRVSPSKAVMLAPMIRSGEMQKNSLTPSQIENQGDEPPSSQTPTAPPLRIQPVAQTHRPISTRKQFAPNRAVVEANRGPHPPSRRRPGSRGGCGWPACPACGASSPSRPQRPSMLARGWGGVGRVLDPTAICHFTTSRRCSLGVFGVHLFPACEKL